MPSLFSTNDLLRSLLNVIVLILAVTVHEYAHALAAYKLGDDYAARLGRLTLNPIAHADVLGTVIVPILTGGFFGWGKPVPYIPNNLTRRFSMRGCEAIVAFAGPLANLITGVLSGTAWVVLARTGLHTPLASLAYALLSVNMALFFFNLIPIPPLDGSKVFSWLLGQKADRALDALTRLGPLGLLVAVFAGGFLISPLVGYVVRAFSSMIA